MKIVVSSCLLGLPCRYDGKPVHSKKLQRLLDNPSHTFLAFCPEFATFNASPRSAIRLLNLPDVADDYRIEFHDGVAVPEQLYSECVASARAAIRFNPDRVILKDGSPVCGTHRVDVGGEWKSGRGLFAQLLHEAGYKIESEEGVDEN